MSRFHCTHAVTKMCCLELASNQCSTIIVPYQDVSSIMTRRLPVETPISGVNEVFCFSGVFEDSVVLSWMICEGELFFNVRILEEGPPKNTSMFRTLS